MKVSLGDALFSPLLSIILLFIASVPIDANEGNRNIVIKFNHGQQHVHTEIKITLAGDVFITNDSQQLNMSNVCNNGDSSGIFGRLGKHSDYTAKCKDQTGSTSSSYATLNGDNFKFEDKYMFHTSATNIVTLTTLYDININRTSCQGYVLKHVRGNDLSFITSNGIGIEDKKIPITDCAVSAL
ncbi:MAG: hypothetical protein ABSF49_17225 [Roseiarcus sp.]|uniref:hypothetical protein n=1 Tax=Roseiarcus sp. TaxID=1969460 RepID=UPI003C1D217B